MSDRDPASSTEAMALALDWATGRRSWANLRSPEGEGPYQPDVLAVMEAQEVLKWTTVAMAFMEMERRADGRRPDRPNGLEGLDDLPLPEGAYVVEDPPEWPGVLDGLVARANRAADEFAHAAFEDGHWPNPRDHAFVTCRVCRAAQAARALAETLESEEPVWQFQRR